MIRYSVYNPKEQKIFVFKYVVFIEKKFMIEWDIKSKIELEEVQETQIDTHKLTL